MEIGNDESKEKGAEIDKGIGIAAGILTKLILILFVIMMSLILGIDVVLQSSDYVCKVDFPVSNVCMFLFFIAVIAAVIIVCRCSKIPQLNLHMENLDKYVNIATIILFVIQIYISKNIYFGTGWDAGMTDGQALTMVYGDSSAIDMNYFSYCPNNVFITIFETCMLRLNKLFGCYAGQWVFLPIVYVNCFFNAAACWMVYRIVKKNTTARWAVLGYILAVFNFGISPWNVICYTDSFGIIFPILIYYIYSKHTDNPFFTLMKYAFLGALGYLAYSIKPQCFIMVLSIAIVELLGGATKRGNWRKTLHVVVCVLCMFLSFGAIINQQDKLYSRAGFALDPEKKLDMYHYFMMGLNEERNGVFDDGDLGFSLSLLTYNERKQGNIEESVRRIKAFGVGGLVHHLIKKTLVIFNDGTYAWGVEGNFYASIYEEPNACSAPFLRSVFYHQGERYIYFCTAEQGLWIFMLIMCILAPFSFLLANFDEQQGDMIALFLSIIGLIIFESLFEARARYLYTYAPIFCILASTGGYSLSRCLRKYKVIG